MKETTDQTEKTEIETAETVESTMEATALGEISIDDLIPAEETKNPKGYDNSNADEPAVTQPRPTASPETAPVETQPTVTQPSVTIPASDSEAWGGGESGL